MDSTISSFASGISRQIADYLPSLVAGLSLIIIGLILGWAAKRVVVQLCLLLRLDRLFRRVRWGADFAKADARYALYGFLGNVVYVIIFLFFLNAAFNALKLKLLSSVIEKGVVFFPKFIVACVVASLGWVIAARASSGVLRALTKERVPRASLIARFSKAVIVLFFSAAALAELDIAREIVVIGFSATIVTLGAVTVVLVSLGGKTLTGILLEHSEDEGKQTNGVETANQAPKQ